MKRPLIVTVMGLLLVLVGLGQAVLGAVVLGKHSDVTFLSDTKLDTSSKAVSVGIVLIVIGVLSVLFAIALLKGSRFARAWVGLVQLSSIGYGIYSIVSLKGATRSASIGTIAGALVVLYFLFGTEKAKAYFAKH